MLVFGCEVWMLNDATMASLRGWCARCVPKVTGRSIREECVDPTYPLVLKVRARRLRWLGHILRSHEGHLVRRVLMAQCQQSGYVLMHADASTDPTLVSAEADAELQSECDRFRVARTMKANGFA